MAKIKEIEVLIGMSIDKNGEWIRADAKVTVSVDPDDNVKDCFDRAAEIVDEQVEKILRDRGVIDA